MKKLVVSDDLSLPASAVTETFGLLAVRGAGKTNAARALAEEMFAAGLPFVVVDPVGSWSGLRSSRDGKGPGLPIPIFGGRLGDMPLERTAGSLLADLVVDKRLSCVIDVSDFDSEAARKQFLHDFARRLYARNEQPLHVFCEEADDYIPQSGSFKGIDGQLLRAWENLVRRGRGRGIGVTLITQRSAAINKSVLTQVQTLIALRTTGPQDRKAIEGWLKYHAQSDEILASLPGLADGEAWVWSPNFLHLTKRFRFRLSHTFDSGATPVAGAGKRTATLADVDLGAIEKEMAATRERAKAEDPKLLRAEVARLKAELQKKPAAEVEQKIVEVPIVDREGLREAGADLSNLGELIGVLTVAHQRARANNAAMEKRLRSAQAMGERGVSRLSTPARAGAASQAAPARAAASRSNGAGSADPEVGRGGLRRILVALAQRPDGLTHRQIGVRAGLSSKSGSFSTYVGKARSSAWITGHSDRIVITEAGLAALGSYDPLPTGRDLLEHWLRELGESGASRILRAVAEAYPKALTHEEVGEAANLSAASGSYSTYCSKLRSLELIEGRKELRASEELFG